MPEFTIDAYSFEVISHERAIRDGVVTERFVVDAFYEGKPLDWHPNQKGREDFPGFPNRTRYEFVGSESVDVYNDSRVKVGTKRGADFRTRFWPNLLHVARKAHAASVLGKTVGEVVDAEVDKAAFVEPVSLRASTLDACVETLVGRRVR